MTDHDTLKAAVHAALDERDGLDRERHRTDHDWVLSNRERERERRERRAATNDKIRATVIGGLVLLVLSGVLSGLYSVGKFVMDLYAKSHTGQ